MGEESLWPWAITLPGLGVCQAASLADPLAPTVLDIMA